MRVNITQTGLILSDLLVAVYERGNQRTGGGSFLQVDGKMIEYSIANHASRILALVEQVANTNTPRGVN